MTNFPMGTTKDIVLYSTNMGGCISCALSESHQYVCSSEQIAEGVVEQVDEGGGVQISVAHHLGGKQGLPGSTAKQTSHHAVAHVHVMGDFLERIQSTCMTFHLLTLFLKSEDFGNRQYISMHETSFSFNRSVTRSGTSLSIVGIQLPVQG